MPYLKSISLHTTVNRSLAYILNPDKTEDLLYTNAVNCLPNAKDAYLMMKTVYEHFSSHKFDEPLLKQRKGRVKAIHYIQSFDPKDNISPELAHQIARTFARKAFGDSCQVVIATHNDKSHIHNHIIINTYGIDGRKFNANKKTLDELKEISDRVCLAFGIQPFDKSKAKRNTIAYNEWQNERRGTSWKQKIRLEIDGLILKVKSVDELLAELEVLGYTVKRGKYISVKAPDQQRAVRLKTLGEDYTVESLASRILWKDVGSGGALLSQPSELNEKYAATIYDVEQLALTGRKIQRKRDTSAPYSPQNDLDVYKLSAQLTIINRDNLRSIGEVEGKINQLRYEVEMAQRELNILLAQQDTLTGLDEQAEEYFSLLDKTERTPADKLRLKMYKTVLESNNITSRSDYEYLKSVVSDTQKKAAPLKENFEKCSRLCELYSEIAKTYYEISRGDYISRLVDEQRKSIGAEQKRTDRNNRI
mgnify:CR=1 FL=1